LLFTTCSPLVAVVVVQVERLRVRPVAQHDALDRVEQDALAAADLALVLVEIAVSEEDCVINC